jgi:hypothetical protein
MYENGIYNINSWGVGGPAEQREPAALGEKRLIMLGF